MIDGAVVRCKAYEHQIYSQNDDYEDLIRAWQLLVEEYSIKPRVQRHWVLEGKQEADMCM
jgi:hypothetical protein